MPSALHVKAAAGREIVDITPERAGWTHVGFRALRMARGESERVTSGERELCVVVLSGRMAVTVDGQALGVLGERASVFEDIGPASVYVPRGHTVQIEAVTDGELALCSAPADEVPRAVRVISPAETRHSVRGQGSNQRFVCDILPHDDQIGRAHV